MSIETTTFKELDFFLNNSYQNSNDFIIKKLTTISNLLSKIESIESYKNLVDIYLQSKSIPDRINFFVQITPILSNHSLLPFILKDERLTSLFEHHLYSQNLIINGKDTTVALSTIKVFYENNFDFYKKHFSGHLKKILGHELNQDLTLWFLQQDPTLSSNLIINVFDSHKLNFKNWVSNKAIKEISEEDINSLSKDKSTFNYLCSLSIKRGNLNNLNYLLENSQLVDPPVININYYNAFFYNGMSNSIMEQGLDTTQKMLNTILNLYPIDELKTKNYTNSFFDILNFMEMYPLKDFNKIKTPQDWKDAAQSLFITFLEHPKVKNNLLEDYAIHIDQNKEFHKKYPEITESLKAFIKRTILSNQISTNIIPTGKPKI